MPMIDDQETLQIFLEDAREHLSGIENDFLAIEAAGAAVDVALVNKVFRAVHSIKGGAGFLGLDAIKDLAHALENLLNLMRNGAVVPTSAMINTLLTAADVLTGLVHDSSEQRGSGYYAARRCPTGGVGFTPDGGPGAATERNDTRRCLACWASRLHGPCVSGGAGTERRQRGLSRRP